MQSLLRNHNDTSRPGSVVGMHICSAIMSIHHNIKNHSANTKLRKRIYCVCTYTFRITCAPTSYFLRKNTVRHEVDGIHPYYVNLTFLTKNNILND